MLIKGEGINMLKSNKKQLYVPFFAVIIVALLFLISQIPTVKVDPKNIPIGIVNEDHGEIGQNIYDSLLENAPEAVKFNEFDSSHLMDKAMNDKEIYGGLVIPKEFSEQIASLQTESPSHANLEIYINEGYNPNVAATLETMLSGIATNIGVNMAGEMLQNMDALSKEMSAKIEEQIGGLQSMLGEEALPSDMEEQLGNLSAMISPIKPSQAQLLSNPIQTEIIKVNEVGNLATVPSALFITVWVSSLLGALLFYFAGNNATFVDRKSKIRFQLTQSLLPIVYGLFAGYAVTLLSTWILGFEFESFHTVALTLSIALMGFVYLMLASLVWLKLPAIGLFSILMFFGLPLIQLAPEMIPTFYQDYVLPWLPMRFLIEGLKDVLFFDKGVMNGNTIVLLGIAVTSFIVIWMKNVMVKVEQ